MDYLVGFIVGYFVKKFLVWDTASKDDNYPKFVYYKIDYSPTRKDKMKRDIKVSNSKKQILNIFCVWEIIRQLFGGFSNIKSKNCGKNYSYI